MKTSVRYGLILAGIGIALSLILYALGFEKDETINKILTPLNIAISATIIFLGIKEQRDKIGNGFISFGSAFSTGMVISLIGGAITAVYTYLYFTIINPGMVTYIQMRQEEEMLNRGMSEAEVEKIASGMAMWMSPSAMTGFAFLGMILIGLILSLICGGILKKDDPTAQIS